MSEFIDYKGYKFEIKIEKNSIKNYRVKCYETNTEYSSDISFEDAMDSIISFIEFGEKGLQLHSSNKEYIENVFKEFLLGKKLSKIDDIVRSEIAGIKVSGSIECILSDNEKKRCYLTEKFKVSAIAARSNCRYITNIIVEDR